MLYYGKVTVSPVARFCGGHGVAGRAQLLVQFRRVAALSPRPDLSRVVSPAASHRPPSTPPSTGCFLLHKLLRRRGPEGLRGTPRAPCRPTATAAGSPNAPRRPSHAHCRAMGLGTPTLRRGRAAATQLTLMATRSKEEELAALQSALRGWHSKCRTIRRRATTGRRVAGFSIPRCAANAHHAAHARAPASAPEADRPSPAHSTQHARTSPGRALAQLLLCPLEGGA
jgi:hypothetical protein